VKDPKVVSNLLGRNCCLFKVFYFYIRIRSNMIISFEVDGLTVHYTL
jgi:hypothetical protein